MKFNTPSVLSFLLAAPGLLSAGGEQTINLNGQPDQGVNNPTGTYAPSNVSAKININLDKDEKSVHFIRDNSDPYVVTRAYVLKNADPYVACGILRSLIRPTIKTNPATVDAIKYNDGTGIVMVSAEENFFQDPGTGMSIESMVKMIDINKMVFSDGRKRYVYFCKANTAATMLKMIRRVGLLSANGVESVTYGRMPKEYQVTIDETHNAIFFNASGFNISSSRAMLAEYDVPACQGTLDYKLIEVSDENDSKLGLDFQSWKNNDGISLFSAGAVFSRSGRTNNYSMLNFNPKWNSKYIDFLMAKSHAKIVHSGSVSIQDTCPMNISVSSGMMGVVVKPVGDKGEVLGEAIASASRAAIKVLNEIPRRVEEMPLSQGTLQEIKPTEGFSFTAAILPSLGSTSASLNVAISGVSLIGYDSTGAPRMVSSSYVSDVQVGTQKDFMIGGITKSKLLRTVNGIPFLKDIPLLGYLFSTETTAIKKSQFILMCSYTPDVRPGGKDGSALMADISKIEAKLKDVEQHPVKALGFEQYGIDTDKIE